MLYFPFARVFFHLVLDGLNYGLKSRSILIYRSFLRPVHTGRIDGRRIDGR